MSVVRREGAPASVPGEARADRRAPSRKRPRFDPERLPITVVQADEPADMARLASALEELARALAMVEPAAGTRPDEAATVMASPDGASEVA